MWVSTALRTSRRVDTQESRRATNAYLNSCQMEIRLGVNDVSHRMPDSHVATVNITVRYEAKTLDGEPQLSIGSCWHRLFRNCEITAGYSIPSRQSKQPGLDIPLDMMADLIRAKRVTQFGLNFLIMGFSSLLYATGYQDGIMTWHLVCNEDGTQISFSDHRVPFISSPTELLPSPKDVGQARHIVGWTNSVRNFTGAKGLPA